MTNLTPAQEKRLAHCSPGMKAHAEEAIAKGKAFCPACYPYANCGYFDECDAWVGPQDTTESRP